MTFQLKGDHATLPPGILRSGGKAAANLSRDLPASWNLDSGRLGFVVVAEFPASEHVVRSGRTGPVMICEFLAGGNFVQCGVSHEFPKVSKRKDGKAKLKPNTGTGAGVRSKVLG